MKNLSFLLFLIFSLNSYAQLPKSLGNGTVKIMMFAYVGKDTLEIENKFRKPFMEMHYFIRDYKVLRNDVALEYSNSNSDESKSTTLSSKIWVPPYIINWKKKTSTFFVKRKDITYYTDTTLVQNGYDLFYKRLVTNNNLPLQIDTFNRKDILINGLPCSLGRYKTNDRWRTFCYTTEKLEFYSPLNSYLPHFRLPIVRIDLDLNDDPVNPCKVTGISRFEILTFTNYKQNPEMFVMPENRVRLTWKEFKDKTLTE